MTPTLGISEIQCKQQSSGFDYLFVCSCQKIKRELQEPPLHFYLPNIKLEVWEPLPRLTSDAISQKKRRKIVYLDFAVLLLINCQVLLIKFPEQYFMFGLSQLLVHGIMFLVHTIIAIHFGLEYVEEVLQFNTCCPCSQIIQSLPFFFLPSNLEFEVQNLKWFLFCSWLGRSCFN